MQSYTKFNFYILFTIVVLFSLVCFFIDKFVPPVSPFVPDGARFRDQTMFGVDGWSKAKIEHARHLPRFDVGLFGNSRILMVSARSMGREPDRVFNFGVGGQSFRHSIYMAEQLAAFGKLPKTIIISFDHVALDYAGLWIEYHDVASSMIGFFRDIRGLFRSPDARKSDFNTLVHTLPRRTAARMGHIFNLDRLGNKLQLFRRAYFDRPTSPATYDWRQDGSRQPSSKAKTRMDPSSEVDPGMLSTDLRYPLLEDDLNRLVEAGRRAGSKVIIYESPLNPALSSEIEAGLDALAHDMRRRLFATCRKISLICFRAPKLPLNRGEAFWADLTHPPAEFIGAWISKIALGELSP